MDNTNVTIPVSQNALPISLTINYVTVTPNSDNIQGNHHCPRCNHAYNFDFTPGSIGNAQDRWNNYNNYRNTPQNYPSETNNEPER